jgi:hypothetical protein
MADAAVSPIPHTANVLLLHIPQRLGRVVQEDDRKPIYIPQRLRRFVQSDDRKPIHVP